MAYSTEVVRRARERLAQVDDYLKVSLGMYIPETVEAPEEPNKLNAPQAQVSGIYIGGNEHGSM